MLKSWSYSRLLTFEACPRHAKLRYEDKIPDPNPSPAADRGTEIHSQAENYINGTLAELPATLKHFQDEFDKVRSLYKGGSVELEGEWGFDKEWGDAPYATAWLRMKADAVVKLNHTHALVVDFKTGRKDGNEIKHTEQCQLYALATFLRNEQITDVTAELWYLDKDELLRITMTREQALVRYLKIFDRRGSAVTKCEDFKPNPNVFSCKYCPYKPSGTGHCEVGVENVQMARNFYARRNAK